MSAPTDPDVRELSTLVTGAAERLRAAFNAAAAEQGLTPVQAAALVNLRESAPMRDLARWLACDPSNVTQIVDALERRGLVGRQPSPQDRRVKALVLTDEGRRRQTVLRERGHAQATELFAALGPDERVLLRDLLARLPGGGCGEDCGPA
ncbi:MarR family winged helix-turn-helix transcriptional regulator [Streptomonospora nanhaiensis]|uniref:MarR family winged helix-turn-helix transcriptional regulator n=1 Tax=Streptomonospora nanhaiensis TaxID=1323731 RepID=UPI001C38AA80|nr:MarR family winged helix-turn-helix transcriptional regulator [Streptomonospora nanhaiensis]MBV2362783.1 MarR family winged helix-turn-helix transcriptional regulator [Streptomonospora nanhaiensis]MBX9388763.1 MarR family winged helix-turn-helix transcriptional regulator [Streptomonospora nanhaiensis]